MNSLRTIIGTAIAGIFVMCVWGAFAKAYGIGGGWFAGFIIISTMWWPGTRARRCPSAWAICRTMATRPLFV